MEGLTLESILDTIASAVAAKMRDGQPASTVKARLFDIDAAAAYLGRTPSAIRHLVNQGRLRRVGIDGRVQFDVKDLDRLIEESKDRAL